MDELRRSGMIRNPLSAGSLPWLVQALVAYQRQTLYRRLIEAGAQSQFAAGQVAEHLTQCPGLKPAAAAQQIG
ncbi:hypothetical protein SDC9_84419 [bioreactor metagenome]|uniref:Uncharacterized protein n=1 Tax=bioreactor metagenome TaxID=1076179 RepID=A0A644ZA91_9ZZZZ